MLYLLPVVVRIPTSVRFLFFPHIRTQSSALILGTTDTTIPTHAGPNNNTTSMSTTALWRVDPTGQFWNCDAAAIGRGAGKAEAWLLRHIFESSSMKQQRDDVIIDWKKEEYDLENSDLDLQRQNEMEFISDYLTNEHVRNFMYALNATDALEVLHKCLIETLSSSTPTTATSNENSSSFKRPRRTWGMLQGMVLSVEEDGAKGSVDSSAYMTKSTRRKMSMWRKRRIALELLDENKLVSGAVI